MGDIIWEEFVEKRDLREKPQEILLEVDGGGKERVLASCRVFQIHFVYTT